MQHMVLTILGKLGGRKFLVALFGALAIGLHSWLGIDESSVIALGGVVAAYVFGQGIADGFSGGLTSSVGKIQN
jgi:hypothetical protein